MNYWLIKSEPDECSISDVANAPQQQLRWDGIRNYQARNFLREMKPADQVMFYHSSCANIGIAGLVEVAGSAYSDPLQFDPNSAYYDARSPIENPRWSAIDVRFVNQAKQVLSLKILKKMPELSESALLNRARLSVMPLTSDEWQAIHSAVDW